MELFMMIFVIGWLFSSAMVGVSLATVTVSGLAILGGLATFVLTGVLLYWLARESKIAGGVSLVWVLFLTWMWAMVMAPSITLGPAVALTIFLGVVWSVGAMLVIEYIQKELV